MIICLIARQIKDIFIYKTNYFPELHSYDRNTTKINLDLFHYATQSEFKCATDINTSKFSKKINLVSLKSKVDKIDKIENENDF